MSAQFTTACCDQIPELQLFRNVINISVFVPLLSSGHPPAPTPS